jgi:hypothetical protein
MHTLLRPSHMQIIYFAFCMYYHNFENNKNRGSLSLSRWLYATSLQIIKSILCLHIFFLYRKNINDNKQQQPYKIFVCLHVQLIDFQKSIKNEIFENECGHKFERNKFYGNILWSEFFSTKKYSLHTSKSKLLYWKKNLNTSRDRLF